MGIAVIDSGSLSRNSTASTSSVSIPYSISGSSAKTVIIACAAQNVDNPVTSVTIDGQPAIFSRKSRALFATLDGCVLICDIGGLTVSPSGDMVISWENGSSKMGAYAWASIDSGAFVSMTDGANGQDGAWTKPASPNPSMIIACRYTYSSGGATVTAPSASLEVSASADSGRRLVDIWTDAGEFDYVFAHGYEGGVMLTVLDALQSAQAWPRGGNVYAPL